MMSSSKYTDYATAVEGDDFDEQVAPSAYFPTQLHYVLRELQKEGKAGIVSWLDHGRAFRVHPGQKERFIAEVLQT
jgi:hypothetical protein